MFNCQITVGDKEWGSESGISRGGFRESVVVSTAVPRSECVKTNDKHYNESIIICLYIKLLSIFDKLTRLFNLKCTV